MTKPVVAPMPREERGRLRAALLHAHHPVEETSAPGRRAFLARFEREADPEGILDPAERRRRAKHLLTAHMIRLSDKARKAAAERKAAKKGGQRA